MEIHIKTIPHHEHRYETVGDYWYEGETLEMRVSEMDDDYVFLVAIHELVESYLCKKRGISVESIDAFDKQFEEDRIKLNWGDDLEPGNDPKAPYKKEHFFAEVIERMVANELKIDWQKYDKTVMSL